MVEVSLTVGKLDASLALLLTKDHHLIEFPTMLLPNGVRAGSIVKLKCEQDQASEEEEDLKFQSIQDEIYQTFATHPPKSPNLQIKNTTQTSCVLEWDALDLGTSHLKNLILFKDGKKLGSIPQPMNNKTSKLSGLPVDKSFKFQLRLDTTAGIFWSNEVEVNTHKMTDLSGITVCLGEFSPNDPFTAEDIEETLVKIGAKHPAQRQVKVDTTHYLCTRENKQNPEYIKASEMNIPIVRPEWIKACERERRIVGVRDFYIKDCVLPDLFAKNYWGDSKGPKNNLSGTVDREQQDTVETFSAPAESRENDTNVASNAEKSELPPLPANGEGKEISESAGVTQHEAPSNENDASFEKQESDSTKLEVGDTEISTAVPNSAQEVNETLKHMDEEEKPQQDGDVANTNEEQEAASSAALREDIDDAFEAVPISQESVVEVETKVSDHPVKSEETVQSAEASSSNTVGTEDAKSKEEKEANKEEKKERESEKESKEAKFEQQEEKKELADEREKSKKEVDEERGQKRDEKEEEEVEESGDLGNDDAEEDESTSKENSPAPTGDGEKKKNKNKKKNKSKNKKK
ncbi:CHS5 [Candida theae]|uniref:Chitin biosynthesis protein CHS5 n=1 Tax=Candida theae TaxID=1198502 RepID=A0AAD5BB70_9ASCO|nr:CHS5 [Candida theae]KAI5949968.1 CHS5 [Candida theae]